jgi:CheY-like chemotaxis protein
MKLLIIEDQAKTGQYLRQGLSEAGFNTELVADGSSGQHLALTGDYALLILDVMLPGRDGWQILQAVRSAGLDTPVLFLTARDAVEDRVRGLELGADDIWSSRLPSLSCWPGSAACCAEAAAPPRKPTCNWPICAWTCCAGVWNATASAST